MRHLFSFLLLFSFILLQAQPLQQLKVDVVYLASDYLEGREAGTAGEQLAAEYIAWRFAELGLQPGGRNGAYFHDFDFDYRTNPHAAAAEKRNGRNVVGLIDNGAPTTVVIGAHYDHLGLGNTSSLHAGEPAIHNGADDNASGIAALLFLAEQLKSGKAKNNNYLFLAFSAEELGLVGSKKWVADPTLDLGAVNYMLNMDMVGRLNAQKVLAVNGVGTSPAWKPALEAVRVGGITTQTTESGIGPSDHTSFYLQNIPVLHFFTGQHREYHKPADDAHLVNYEGLLSVSEYILALIQRLDGQGKLAFTKTRDEDEKREVASFKVSLGVMPDYVHAGKGMRVDAVIEGRPGAKAGMKDGDIIIGIGNMEVTDIYTYMEGLSKFKAGDKTQVKVKRGEEELTLDVEF